MDSASAPLVRKTRIIFDEGTNQWYDEYEANDLRGGKTHVLVSREASQPNEVAKPLRKKGAGKATDVERPGRAVRRAT
jgi:hypothetical protein